MCKSFGFYWFCRHLSGWGQNDPKDHGCNQNLRVTGGLRRGGDKEKVFIK